MKSVRCMQPNISYIDKWSLSAQIRIVNIPLIYHFPSSPQQLLDINVYVTDSVTLKSRLALKLDIHHPNMDKINVMTLHLVGKFLAQISVLLHTIWCEQGSSIKPNEGSLGAGAKETTPVVLAEMNEKDLGFLATFPYMTGEEPLKWAFQRVSPGKKEEGD